ncbi:hypothetical protein A6A19_00345 [Actinobacillus delphinicola]|uniref:type IV secretion system protein VirB10 n=1 Tax=Actinobacillus delphinicola TaxID=51161 RepID=UPI0024420E07|nr:type IV secretion system protein VirB10 [Actinobacillus delphinicola]MDG6896495.1 hypothetical protein [Actinobacillus delphinicola]
MTDIQNNSISEAENNEQEHVNANEPCSQLPKKPVNKRLGIFIMLGGFLIFALIFFPNLFKSFLSDKPVSDSAKTDDNTVSVVVKNDFGKTKEDKKPQQFSFTDENTEKNNIPDKPNLLIGDDTPASTLPPKVIKGLAGNLMIKSNGANTTGRSSNSISENTEDPSSLMQERDIQASRNLLNHVNDNADNGDIFEAPTFKPLVAKINPLNPHLTLSQGTVIPCSLRGRLVSNIGGQISCIIADNVYSQSGAVLLLEKGTIVNGYYKGNSVKPGQNEIFVIWQQARTPNNLIIPLNSGSTDPLGANGINGYVDNHFWQRFGNAIVLSLIQDASGVLANRASKSTNGDQLQNTREQSVDIAKTVLEKSGDIMPTIYKNQGDKINIFVSRDIDFSGVYSLKRGNQ